MCTEHLRRTFGEYGWQLIRWKARDLAGRYGFSVSDRQDIEQQLALDVSRRLRHFDPTRATLDTFVRRIVNHHAARMVARQRASKRDYRLDRRSLNDWVKTSEGHWLERGETYDQDDYFLGMRRRARRGEELLDLRIDVRRAVGSLPRRLQEVCAHIQKDGVTEMARRMGLPRWRIYEMRDEIRARFEKMGLRDYL